MRVVPFVLVAALAAGVLTGAQTPGTEAAAVLAAARQALGGDQKLAAIKSFSSTGRTRQVRGDNLVPIEFEILCELPDKYVRRDEVPAQESAPTSAGFNGDLLIQVPPMPEPPASPARPAAPAPPATGAAAVAGTPAPAGPEAKPPTSRPDPKRARVISLKQDFVRLTLGMFATSFASYPLTFSMAGHAEAPQGKADVLDVKGPANFAARLFINSETHLPIMVSWTVPATNVVMQAGGQPAPRNLPPGTIVVQVPAPPGPGASKEDQDKYAKAVQEARKSSMGKPVEYRLYYADYREIGNGVRFPFRLRRAVGADTVEETTFDGFRVNPRIDARKFEVAKPPTAGSPQ